MPVLQGEQGDAGPPGMDGSRGNMVRFHLSNTTLDYTRLINT